MGGAASVPDDRSPYQTSGSVRTKFFFKPPLNLGLRKNLSNKNLSAEVSSQSNFKKAEKDILVPIVTDYATDDEKFSKDVFERSSKIDGQHKVHMTESGRQSFMTFIKAE